MPLLNSHKEDSSRIRTVDVAVYCQHRPTPLLTRKQAEIKIGFLNGVLSKAGVCSGFSFKSPF